MVEPSPLLQSLSARIYVFATVALGLKLLEVSAITISDVSLDVGNKPKLVLGLTVAVSAMVLTAAFCLIRDMMQVAFAPSDEVPAPQEFLPKPSEQMTAVERLGQIYLIVQWALFLLVSVLPIAYGFTVVCLCLPDSRTGFAALFG